MSEQEHAPPRYSPRHGAAHGPAPALPDGVASPDRAHRTYLSRLAGSSGLSRLPTGARRGLGIAGLVVALTLVGGTASAAFGGPSPFGHQPASARLVGSTPGAPAAGSPAPATSVGAPVPAVAVNGLAANGIPNVALNAYRVAAARLASTEPGCGLDWSLLAGLGRVESDHGQLGGARLNSDGTSTPKLIGPALNGKSNPLVGDTDGGALDGDPVYDHAIGAMQMVPSVWTTYAADGNGDGVADPFNINDEALAAGRYLCTAGGNLRTSAGQSAALSSYNQSSQYVAEIIALATNYAKGLPVGGTPPVGATTGTLPSITPQAHPAAANPATPPAVSPGQPGVTAAATVGSGSSADNSAPASVAETSSTPAASPTTATPTTSGASGSKPHTPPNGGWPTTTPTEEPTLPTLPAPPSEPRATPSPSRTCRISLLGVCLEY